MNTRAITYTSLVITLVGLVFLSEVRGELNGAKEYKALADFWKGRVAREQLKKLIAMGQFADFKQDVALLLPDRIKRRKVDEERKRLRNLASVIPHEGTHEVTLGYSAEKLLKDGKQLVVDREFGPGVDKLKKLIKKFPDSYHVIEAHYLIIEAYAAQDKNQLVIEWVDKMVEVFPENRLTGYAMLKVGGIYELDGRHEDAVRIYKTIVAVYSDEKLIHKAQVAVKELTL